MVPQQPLVFGVFPLGIAGGPEGVLSGPPDDVGRIGDALRDLAGDGAPLLVRMSVTFEGRSRAHSIGLVRLLRSAAWSTFR